MMMRSILAVLVLSSAMSVALPAYSQVTDQTDQSEEDWRNSRKKSGTTDIYRTPNSTRTGLGLPTIDYEPPTPLERLPSESRRHLMRERAKAIAESPDGDISDVEYVPSDAAQNDPQLQQDEQDAWEAITAGPDGDSPDGDTAGQSATPTSPSGQTSGQSAGQGSSQSQGQSQGGAQGQSQTVAQAPRGGSTGSLQEIMDAIKSEQSGSGSQAGGSGSAGAPQSNGSSSGGSGDGSSGGESGNGSSSASSSEDLSPLELIRRSKEDRAAEGQRRSASDYLGQESDQTPDE